jgi:hypothetical protein
MSINRCQNQGYIPELIKIKKSNTFIFFIEIFILNFLKINYIIRLINIFYIKSFICLCSIMILKAKACQIRF